MNLFEMEKLTYYYPGTARPALDHIDLLLREGDFVLIAGPSGGGKTTLARALSGLVPHFFGGRIGGRVRYRGDPLGDLDRRALNSQIGVVTQDAEKQILMTRVEHELRFGPENLGLPPGRIRQNVAEMADLLGLSALLRRRTDELSGGMKQRTVLGAVMAMGARIMILDEPTSQLDPASAEDLRAFLSRARNEIGYTILLIEHRIESFLPMADRLLFVEGGRLTFDGGLDEFRRWAPNHAPHILTKPRGVGVSSTARGETHNAIAPNPPPSDEARAVSKGPIVEICNVSFSYGNNDPALKEINLTINRGEIVSILGPNGAGKSTLLKIICGILRPSNGEVAVAGRTASRCPN
ncbi:MAG: ABC transporter ATP-binding protein, partial [bacterium]